MRKQIVLLIGGCVIAVAMLMGCTAGPTDQTLTISTTNYKEIGDRTIQYRRQAAELRNAAARFEWEAEQYAQQAGKDSEQAQQKRELAKQTWAAAAEADALAREYRKQLPHNFVY